MAAQAKRVFYMKYLADPVYVDIFSTRPDMILNDLDRCRTENEMNEILSTALAYQITSARGEISPDFYADTPLLKRAPNLLVVSTNGVGYDTVNLQACTDAGVLAVNPAGANRESVAEHVLGMMLCLSKKIIQADRLMRRTSDFDRLDFMGNEIFGKTIGIVGIGHVGSRLAELCRAFFAMSVLAYDPYLDREEIAARGAEKVELEDLLRRGDFVSINCPLTEETRGMIGTPQFSLMKPSAFFISTARGHIHNEEDLAEAIKRKQIAGAGIDVWEREPPAHDHPLFRYDNVLASPHNAGVTREARCNIASVAAEQLFEILDGKRPLHILNPEVWPLYARRFERRFGFAPVS